LRRAPPEGTLSAEDRRHHVYFVSQAVSGKTAFLRFCILQDIYAGAGLAFNDPHGEFADDVVDSLPGSCARNVIFNPFCHVTPQMRAVAASDIIANLPLLNRTFEPGAANFCFPPRVLAFRSMLRLA